MYSPIALFTYERLDLLKKTVNYLKKNALASKTDLYIFSDGPKDKVNSKNIKNVRIYLERITGFQSIKIIKRKINVGLERNLIQGLEYIFRNHERVIVLEDDIATSKYFLEYLNDALNEYENAKNVCQVSGYSFLEKYSKKYDLDDFYFIKGADCLAWGTWKDRWDLFTNDALRLSSQIRNKNLIGQFNRNHNYNYFKMLLDKSRNKNNSWAICWYAKNFLENKYTLYPLKSLASHLGNDIKATNYIPSQNDSLEVKIHEQSIKLKRIPIYEKINTFKAYNEFLKKSKGNFFERIKCFLKVKIRQFS